MSIALICRILLALVLGGAALGKFQDLDETRQMLRDFGLADAVARPIGTLLPGVELVIALGLLPPQSAVYAAWAAAALMAIFSAVIGVNLALGRRPGCKCFGPLLTATAISWRTLSRNLLLVALAAAVIVRA